MATPTQAGETHGAALNNLLRSLLVLAVTFSFVGRAAPPRGGRGSGRRVAGAGEVVVGGNPEPVAEAVGLAPNPSSRAPGLCGMAGFELVLCTLS